MVTGNEEKVLQRSLAPQNGGRQSAEAAKERIGEVLREAFC